MDCVVGRARRPVFDDTWRGKRMAMNSGYVVLAERGLVALRGDEARACCRA